MKTTGVKDIPKFGLLFFLGHPTAQGGLERDRGYWKVVKLFNLGKDYIVPPSPCQVFANNRANTRTGVLKKLDIFQF